MYRVSYLKSVSMRVRITDMYAKYDKYDLLSHNMLHCKIVSSIQSNYVIDRCKSV